jgi:hypothetical protein
MDGLGYLQVVSWVLGLILVVCSLYTRHCIYLTCSESLDWVLFDCCLFEGLIFLVLIHCYAPTTPSLLSGVW